MQRRAALRHSCPASVGAEVRGHSASDVEAIEIEIVDAEQQVTALEAPAKGDECSIANVDMLKRSFALMSRLEELAAESLERGCQRKRGGMEDFHLVLGLIDRLSVSMENNRPPNSEPEGEKQDEGVACENEDIQGAGEWSASLVKEVPADAIAMQTPRPEGSIACVSSGGDAMVVQAVGPAEFESIVCKISWAGGYAAGLLSYLGSAETVVCGIGWSVGFVTGLAARVSADASRYVSQGA